MSACPELADLPVVEVLDDVAAALAAGRDVLLVAPPGAGKTTVAPLRLVDEPWLAGRSIVVLEPRRLATRAAARRMAALLGEQVGERVGFQTRDERHIGRATRIEVVTEGVLTRRLQHDPSLDGVGLVVFDEVHERNLPTDLGLALALDARAELRPDLRILAMSATPDVARLTRGARRSARRHERRPAAPRRRPLGAAGQARAHRGGGGRDDRPGAARGGRRRARLPPRHRRDPPGRRAARRRPRPRRRRVPARRRAVGRRAGRRARPRRRPVGGASCCPPTSPSRRSRCPACASSSTPAWPASRASTAAPG